MSSEEKAHAVIASGATPTSSIAAGTNDFHCSYCHMQEDLLKRTAKQIIIKLQGQLAPCEGCSGAKGIRKPVKPVTQIRAVRPAERCFVDLVGPTSVQSSRGKEYMMIVRDGMSRFARVFSSVPKTRQPRIFQRTWEGRSTQGRGPEE